MINIESKYIQAGNRSNHIRCFTHPKGIANILLLHGSIEDGKIFYSLSNKGFAPFLHKHNFNAFVIDLGGRGLSKPEVKELNNYGHSEAISEDIPSALKMIEELYPDLPLFLVGHSWGGVIALCFTIRYKPENLKGIICFGSKRRITVQHFEKWLAVNLIWKSWGTYQTRKLGYFPAKKWKIGSQNEPGKLYHEINEWIHPKSLWIDQSNFNYANEASEMNSPRVLHFAGIKDRYLGHPIDVKLFATESKLPYDFKLLSKSNGYKKDYGHIDMLTDSSAPNDHFPESLIWIHNQLKT